MRTLKSEEGGQRSEWSRRGGGRADLDDTRRSWPVVQLVERLAEQSSLSTPEAC